MPAVSEQPKRITPPIKSARKPVGLPGQPVAHSHKPDAILDNAMSAGRLRARLGLTQPQFASMLPLSVRSLATLERGTAPTEAVARRLTELGRLVTALSEVMKAQSIGRWLRTPNPAFAGLTPADVIERGEADRLWAMIYFLRSGVAF